MDRKILHRFFEGTATFDEEEAVCDWVDASEKNREELIKERKYFDITFLGKRQSREQKKYRRFYLSPLVEGSLKVAVVIALLIVSAVHVYKEMTEKVPIAFNRIQVPSGQRVNLILSDGTGVWLNACSELVYPSSFTGSHRIVHLKGEGYFEVKKNTDHPFVVETNKFDIKVLGTKFNVNVDEDLFTAALMEGSIALSDRNDPDMEVRLSPNQKAEWKEGRLEVHTIRNLDDYRWKEGLVCFDKVRFVDLMHRFERIYDIRIVIQNKELEEYACTGKFRISDGLDYILQVLQNSKPFTFTRDEKNTVVYLK